MPPRTRSGSSTGCCSPTRRTFWTSSGPPPASAPTPARSPALAGGAACAHAWSAPPGGPPPGARPAGAPDLDRQRPSECHPSPMASTAGDFEIRLMREGEEAAVAQLAQEAFTDLDRRLGHADPPATFHRRVARRVRRWLGRTEPLESPREVARRVGRFEHLRTTDPDGSWVALRD